MAKKPIPRAICRYGRKKPPRAKSKHRAKRQEEARGKGTTKKKGAAVTTALYKGGRSSAEKIAREKKGREKKEGNTITNRDSPTDAHPFAKLRPVMHFKGGDKNS